jgi:hypothetical protein
MRIVAILGGLLIGLVGLFLSVCGGGLLASIAYNELQRLLGAHANPNDISAAWIFPAGFLALGIFLCWKAYRIVRKSFKNE